MQQRQRLPHRLLRRVSEQLLRAGVPAADLAFGAQFADRVVVERVQQLVPARRQHPGVFFGGVLDRDIAVDHGETAGPGQRHDHRAGIEHGAVAPHAPALVLRPAAGPRHRQQLPGGGGLLRGAGRMKTRQRRADDFLGGIQQYAARGLCPGTDAAVFRQREDRGILHRIERIEQLGSRQVHGHAPYGLVGAAFLGGSPGTRGAGPIQGEACRATPDACLQACPHTRTCGNACVACKNYNSLSKVSQGFVAPTSGFTRASAGAFARGPAHRRRGRMLVRQVAGRLVPFFLVVIRALVGAAVRPADRVMRDVGGHGASRGDLQDGKALVCCRFHTSAGIRAAADAG
jgi:hypothetical protein